MPDQSKLGFMGRGALEGGVTGVILALVYVLVLAPLLALYGSLSATNVPSLNAGMLNAMQFVVCAIPFGVAMAALPAGIVGAIGGAAIGLCFALLMNRLNRGRAALLGACVGLALMGLINLVIAVGGRQMQSVPPLGYALALGLPSLLMVIGMAVVGWRMAQLEIG